MLCCAAQVSHSGVAGKTDGWRWVRTMSRRLPSAAVLSGQELNGGKAADRLSHVIWAVPFLAAQVAHSGGVGGQAAGAGRAPRQGGCRARGS